MSQFNDFREQQNSLPKYVRRALAIDVVKAGGLNKRIKYNQQPEVYGSSAHSPRRKQVYKQIQRWKDWAPGRFEALTIKVLAGESSALDLDLDDEEEVEEEHEHNRNCDEPVVMAENSDALALPIRGKLYKRVC
jgi:hypothetical protein